MKKLLLSIIMLAATATAFAQAPSVFGPFTQIAANGYTNAASSTSNYTATAGVYFVQPVAIHNASTVGIYTLSQCDAADGADTSSEVIFKFALSVDGSNWETTPQVLVTNVCNSTTAVKNFNAQTIAGAKLIRLASIVNGSANNLTNVCVKIGVKGP